MKASDHVPVLLQEFLSVMKPGENGRLLDGTLGLGGHTAAFLNAFSGSTAVGIELDPAAASEAEKRLAEFKGRVQIVRGSYSRVKDFTTGGGILFPPMFTHILLDLGIGSHQLSDKGRGFSFTSKEAISMRFGEETSLPAANVEALNVLEKRLGFLPDASELIRFLSPDDLATVIRTYGEEKYAGRIASALKAQGEGSSAAVAEAIKKAVPAVYRHGRIHPATRTFQALRLAVNRELEVLQAALPQLVEVLAPEGKIAVISFHSLEDRIVKQFFKQESTGCICPPEQIPCICGHLQTVELMTKKPIVASETEVEENPRSRSAKMRVARRLRGG